MKLFLFTLLIAAAFHCTGHTNTKQILETLSSFNDQYDQPFNTNLHDSIFIIYISGLENPLTIGNGKLKAKIVSNPARVFVVGAFDNIPGGKGKINHIKSGFISKYGKNYTSILLDAEGVPGKILKTDGLSIIVLKNASNHAINKYFN